MSEEEKEEFMTTLRRLDKRSERMEFILMGDAEAQQDGLVHKVKSQGDLIKEIVPTVAKNTVKIDHIDKHDERIKSLEGDRNKVKGAMWFTGTTAFGGIVTFFYTLWKH